MSRGDRSSSRARRSVALGAGLTLVGAAALTQFGAEADPVSSDVPARCSILGSSLDVTIPVVVDDRHDPVAEGAPQVVVLETGMSELEVEVTMNRLIVTLPIPAEIASVDEVTFAGGNMAGSWTMSGPDLVLTFTGPQPSSAMDLPTVTIDQTVATGVAPTTITWTTFSKIDAETNYGTANCVPNDPGQVVNTTQVEGSGAEPAPVTEPPEQAPPTDPGDPPEPAEPPPAEAGSPGPSDGAGPDVSAEVDVEVDLPDLPAPPEVPPIPSVPPAPPVQGVPLPAPGGTGVPALPPSTGTPEPPSPPQAAPLPGLPSLPGGPVPTLPTLPALPTLPGIELDVEVTFQVGVGT